AARLLKGVRRLKQQLAKVVGRGSPPGVEEAVEDLFTVFRLPEAFRVMCEANYRLLVNYRVQVYPGRITLFRAHAQPLFCRQGADLGWGPMAGGGLTIEVIPGTHDSMLRQPYVRVLAQKLNAALQQTANT